jgi:hypothetical protein
VGSELPAGIAVRYIGDVDAATNAYRQFPDTGRAIYSGAALAAARPRMGAS